MAITENKKYAIIPIRNEWSNFRVEHCGKDITIFGYDGKTTDQWAGAFDDKPTEPVYEEVVLTGIEQHWSDLAVWSVLDEGTDEDGKRYLILVREEI